jgi:hypothetical protein
MNKRINISIKINYLINVTFQRILTVPREANIRVAGLTVLYKLNNL